jgi:hypothetical protein
VAAADLPPDIVLHLVHGDREKHLLKVCAQLRAPAAADHYVLLVYRIQVFDLSSEINNANVVVLWVGPQRGAGVTQGCKDIDTDTDILDIYSSYMGTQTHTNTKTQDANTDRKFTDIIVQVVQGTYKDQINCFDVP